MSYQQYNRNSFVDRMCQRFSLSMDNDWTERESILYIYKKFLDSTIYDNLAPWNCEYEGGQLSGKYTPLAKRRPSVIYAIPQIIVNESTSMLFGDNHFPIIRGADDEDTRTLKYISDSCFLPSKMMDAAKKGSLGSVCVLVKVLLSQFFIDVLDTVSLIPVFDEQRPGKLLNLREKRKVTGATLQSKGYEIDDKDRNKLFFAMREWTEFEEIYYIPFECKKSEDINFLPEKDEGRSSIHNLGFVPAVWIKNSSNDEKIDGDCTFSAILDTCIEIDYQLSQLGRLLKYNSDPTLVIKDPSNLSDQQLIKGIGPITLGENGDAWMLEMTSGSTNAVIDYVRCLRDFAIEVVRGNRANPEKISGLHSGKALQMLNANLIEFVSSLRVSYGNGLKDILDIIFQIIDSEKFIIDLNGNNIKSLNKNDVILDWGQWYPPTPQDDLQESQTIVNYVDAGIISRSTGTRAVADQFNIIDVLEEIKVLTNFNKNEMIKTV